MKARKAMDEKLKREINDTIADALRTTIPLTLGATIDAGCRRFERSTEELSGKISQLNIVVSRHDTEIEHLKGLDGRLHALEVGPEAPACARFHEDVRKLTESVGQMTGGRRGRDKFVSRLFKVAQLLVPIAAVMLTYYLTSQAKADQANPPKTAAKAALDAAKWTVAGEASAAEPIKQEYFDPSPQTLDTSPDP